MTESLTPEQKTAYDRDGLLFPLPALTPRETIGFKEKVEQLENYFGGRIEPGRIIQPQLHFQWAYRLVTHPRILDVVESILGPDIMVHSASIFSKHPDDRAYVSQHQDGYYWQLNQPRLVSAWVALSDSDEDNGCMFGLPGSHHQGRLPHHEIRNANNMLATGLTLNTAVETEEKPVVLSAGDMSLHHVDLVHGSKANKSDRVRMGFAIRFGWPGLRQKLDHHQTILARGRDDYGHYQHLREPPGPGFEKAMERQERFAEQLWQRRMGTRKRAVAI